MRAEGREPGGRVVPMCGCLLYSTMCSFCSTMQTWKILVVFQETSCPCSLTCLSVVVVSSDPFLSICSTRCGTVLSTGKLDFPCSELACSIYGDAEERNKENTSNIDSGSEDLRASISAARWWWRRTSPQTTRRRGSSNGRQVLG